MAAAPPEVEKSSYVYIVDGEGVPRGVASVRDLVRAPRSDLMAKVMSETLVVANASDSAVDAAKVLRDRRYAMLPVLDENKVMVGVLTLDDVADILARSVADQFAGIAGGCLPFLIKRLGYDPAMMTGPLLTTITDVTGVSVYLGLSTLFLAGLASM